MMGRLKAKPCYCREQLDEVDIFSSLGSCIPSVGGRKSDEMPSRIQKTRLVFANLRDLWRRYDIRLSIEGRATKSALLYGLETAAKSQTFVKTFSL